MDDIRGYTWDYLPKEVYVWLAHSRTRLPSTKQFKCPDIEMKLRAHPYGILTIATVLVPMKMRGQRVFSVTLSWLESYAAHCGYNELVCEDVIQPRLHDFYRRHGYTIHDPKQDPPCFVKYL